jgi:hypothetical protein
LSLLLHFENFSVEDGQFWADRWWEDKYRVTSLHVGLEDGDQVVSTSSPQSLLLLFAIFSQDEGQRRLLEVLAVRLPNLNLRLLNAW